jgi:hypothetical protein
VNRCILATRNKKSLIGDLVKEGIMAMAQSVRRVGEGFGRLAITDSDGKEWGYARRGSAGRPYVPVVVAEQSGVRLVLAMDQRPVLRQAEPGLPLNIAVQIGKWEPGVPVYQYVRCD